MPGSNSLGTRLAVCGLLAAIAAGAAGCEQYRARRDTVSFEGGNAVAHNIAVQTVDPWPTNVRDDRIAIDGDREVIAVERYKVNKSIPPKGIATQTIAPNGNGGVVTSQ
jgi:hypothetical protein